MLDLLLIEYKKIIPYKTFWVVFGLFFIFTPIVFYGVGRMNIIDFSSMYHFPDVWNGVTYIASWFNLLIGSLIVILVCNEFTFKTFRQNVIDGQSKTDFVISKILLMISFSLICTIYLFVLGLVFGLVSGGGSFLSNIKYLLIYFIQALGYMSIGFIVAVLIRAPALSIITFLCSILTESIVRALVPDSIDQYFPMKIISNLTPFPVPKGILSAEMKNSLISNTPNIGTTLIIGVIYILIFWGLSSFILTKRDIK